MGIRNSIAGALPQLIAAENQLRERANALGITYVIADFGGTPRTQADTTLIMAYRADDYAKAVARDPSVADIPIDDWRPIRPFGSSMHNYGAAFDVKIMSAPAGVSFDDALQQLKDTASSVGLRSNVPNDQPHFELPITLDDAKAQWAAQGNPTTGFSPGISILTTPENVAATSTAAIVVIAILILAYLRRRT
jgi:hypothetical protein